MMVMVVEDSLAVRERLVTMIAEIVGKNSVIEAAGVMEAISQMPDNMFDVIVLDLLLPDGNGLDVLRMVKAAQQSTQVLVMTNDPNEQYKKRALQLGANYFFDKAKDFDKAINTISAMLTEKAVQTKH